MVLVKIGPHIQNPTAAALAAASNAGIVKSLNASSLDRAQSGAITIYRHYFQYQDIYRNGGDVANEVIAALGGRHPTYLELFNEIAQTFGEGFARYVQFHKEAALVIHAYGSKLLGYSFSTWEHPGLDVYDYMAANSWGDVDAIGIHEYWGLQGFTPVNALYHRVLHAHNPNHPPFLISETGIDAVEGASNGYINTGMSGDAYIQMIRDYDALLQQDSYVIGGNVFTCGPDYSLFAGFDVDPLVGRLWGVTQPPPPGPPPSGSGGLWWGTLPLLAIIGVAVAALIITESGVSEAGSPAYRTAYQPALPELPPGTYDARLIKPGEPIPAGYTVIGEWG